MTDGQPVSPAKLRGAWDRAREAAKAAAKEAGDAALAEAIRKAWLRDARKRAGRKLQPRQRQELLQHADLATTERHYPGAPTRLKPAG